MFFDLIFRITDSSIKKRTTQGGHREGRTHGWKEDHRLKEKSFESRGQKTIEESERLGHRDARTNRWIGPGTAPSQAASKQKQRRRPQEDEDHL
ncbi:hypothetical protein L5515_002684 [Caenorhabditis briggsae]|uniref:Uncharacterized protein n=1 Tax=Caenorhabditis briggsae TaxID=6238 RepID=A0AAE9E4Q0_CAEBR|nr:hypothetical protein L5515_002684 [Caenorhabditis briggsae]